MGAPNQQLQSFGMRVAVAAEVSEAECAAETEADSEGEVGVSQIDQAVVSEVEADSVGG